jgi:hypothetical protein
MIVVLLVFEAILSGCLGSFLEVSAKPCGNKLLGLPSLLEMDLVNPAPIAEMNKSSS